MARAQVYCAIDRGDLAAARDLATAVAPAVDGLKFGLEFFTANGPEGLRLMRRLGRPIFLDLKLCDIPNTVVGAVRAVAPLQPRYLTLHAGGGRAMLRDAVAAGLDTGAATRFLAVTVLTSLDGRDLQSLGVHRSPTDQVRALAELALEAGCHGLVCSPAEVSALRETFGPKPILAIPGIRPKGEPAGDQKRTLEPWQAQAAGADVLVVGRPITGAVDPATAAAALVADLEPAGG